MALSSLRRSERGSALSPAQRMCLTVTVKLAVAVLSLHDSLTGRCYTTHRMQLRVVGLAM
jgi:hypothetical protein